MESQRKTEINNIDTPRAVVSETKPSAAVEAQLINDDNQTIKVSSNKGSVIKTPQGARTVGSVSGTKTPQSNSSVTNVVSSKVVTRTTVENRTREGAKVVNVEVDERTVENVNDSGKLFYEKGIDPEANSTIIETTTETTRGSGRQFDNK